MNRALRRHHRERLLERRRFHWGRPLTPAEAARAVDTPTPYSCALCCNPRRLGEQTRQERIAIAHVDEHQKFASVGLVTLEAWAAAIYGDASLRRG